MSQENVGVIWRQNAGVRRGDLDPIAATIDPHVLIRTDARWPEQRIYGRDAALAWYGGFLELCGTDYRIEEVADLGDRNRPSKPWGWRSRRCRRSTWRWCAGQ